MDKMTSTILCEHESLNPEDTSKARKLCAGTTTARGSESDHNSEDVSVSDTSTDDNCESKAYKAIIRYHNKLVIALSNDIIAISGALLANDFIPDAVSSKMLLQAFTPQEKATILLNAITNKIKLAPQRFDDLMKCFSEQQCTKDIVGSLYSQISRELYADDENDSLDCDAVAVSHSEPGHAVSENHTYTAWATLSAADKINLEARLTTDAEMIRKQFALLCWKIRDSLEDRHTKPRTLASALLDLTVHEDSSESSSLLQEEKEALMQAKSVHDIFDVLRPHMNFFNYEILQFIIEGKGSKDDKSALAKFLKNFKQYCQRHVFEVPFNVSSNLDNTTTQQVLHVKMTKAFRSAILIRNMTAPMQSLSDDTAQVSEKVCSGKLNISLEDAKNIQRKLAQVINVEPFHLYLDSISEGSVILSFLLPTCVSLTGLDNHPEIALLSSNGVIILCGPPGRPELEEMTPNGVIVKWSQPTYGCSSLSRYILYYKMKSKCESCEWQKMELTSLETYACVADLSEGGTCIFKICAVSDAGTYQYSYESDPITTYNSSISVKDFCKIIDACREMVALVLSLADLQNIATRSSAKEIIAELLQEEISIPSTLRHSERTMILSAIIHKQLKSKPWIFSEFLGVLSKELVDNSAVEAIQSIFYHSVYVQYTGYLKFLYMNLHSEQTSCTLWSPATHKYFRLAMIEAGVVKREHIDDAFVRMTVTGKVDDILRRKYPIKLESIFLATRGDRKVVLLEGAPGCGKSTLSVYICQQWEKGQLFNQFKLVILVQLRDPAVQSAENLSDLLPCSDTATAHLLAKTILEMRCQGVLFVVDGWDELPFHLRKKPIFDNLVNCRLPASDPLCNSTVIITSRPISSGDLYPRVSSRVEILGFTAEELYQFFAECLKGDTEAVKTLLERIEENPEVAGSCYLPLNATILVHLFKSDRNTLPTTLYGIFSSLILNCIRRHVELRTQYKDVSIESLNQLPEFAKKPFSNICEVAYNGVMEDKIIFTSLPADVDTLSLLQGVQSLIGREKRVSYNFIHLSIQELLAAWYIATQLPAKKQVSDFHTLFNKPRFAAIFQFYAAITKLKAPGIEDVVSDMVKNYSRSQGYLTPKEDKLLMLSLFHCLYEAQDPSLCDFVARKLTHGLDVSHITLSPSNCLCIGYFLGHVCKMNASEFKVNLDECGIGEQGCRYLASGLCKFLGSRSVETTPVSLNVSRNAIDYQGIHHLSALVKTEVINDLNLSYNNLFAVGRFFEELKSITLLRTLRLQGCGITSYSTEGLAEALTANKHLKVLSISDNALCDDGIQHLAHALEVNEGLKTLLLLNCSISDEGLAHLAKSLQYNKVLNELQLWNSSLTTNNMITEKVVPFLTKCLSNNCALTRLKLPGSLRSFTTSIEDAVNVARKKCRLPLIKVRGEMDVPVVAMQGRLKCVQRCASILEVYILLSLKLTAS